MSLERRLSDLEARSSGACAWLALFRRPLRLRDRPGPMLSGMPGLDPRSPGRGVSLENDSSRRLSYYGCG